MKDYDEIFPEATRLSAEDPNNDCSHSFQTVKNQFKSLSGKGVMNQHSITLTNFRQLMKASILTFILIGLSSSVFAQTQATPVAVDEVRSESLSETVSVFGELVSRQSGTVDVSISAPVKSIHVSVGDRVEEGDLLATLDPSIFELQRASVEARIDMSSWAVQRRVTELDLAKQQEDRFRQLRHSAATSEAQLEDAELRLKIAQQVLGETRAAGQQIERELDIAEYNLSQTEIIAPYSGVVVDRLIEVGQFARAGSQVVRLIGDTDLEIEAYIPYRYIDALQVGDEITAEFDNGRKFQTKLRAFIPEEHVSTRTRAVRFTFSHDEYTDTLAVNQNVMIYIPIASQREVVTVHKDAVVSQQNGHIVFVVKDGTALPKPISIGDASGNRFEVSSGLEIGEVVVTRGNERLQPGQAVTIIGE